MVRRVLSLAVALAIAGAPVALQACALACGSTLARPMASHDTHDAHDQPAAATDSSCHEPSGPALILSPQAPHCDHDGEASVARVAAVHVSDGLLLAAAAIRPVTDSVAAAATTSVAIRQATLSDRRALRLASPLRI